MDLKFALRQLLKNPGFTVVAVLTLALGIGANTAMFSVINAVLIRPLPFRNPAELVSVWQEYPKRAWPKANFSMPNFADLRKDTEIFAGVGAYALSAHTLTGDEQPQRLNTIRMSASFLPALGVQPVLGRNFLETEDHPDGERVALLSDQLWRARYQADPAIVGRSIRLNNDWPVTIIGVLPKGFRIGDERPELCLPLRLDPAKVGRGQRGLDVIARLKPGVSESQLKSKLAVRARQLREADSWANGEMQLNAGPLQAQLVGEVRPGLLTLGGAVACVLLIACANVANLSLARALARQGEITIRAAVGASRGRIMGQLLTESLLLALVGGGVGLLLGRAGVSVAGKFLAARLPQAVDITLDPTVLIFTLLASVLCGILFGLVPALSASRVNLAWSLKDAAKGATVGLARYRLRGALVAAEVSVAFVLLTGAGLLLKSLSKLNNFNPGFDPSGMLVAHTVLLGNRYADNTAARLAAAREITFRLEGLPGVAAVTFGNSLPLTSDMDASGSAIEGRTFAAHEYPFVRIRGVAANYFQTLHVPLLEGRHLAPSDNETGEKVAVINATMARRYWPEESAVGKRVRPDALQTKDWLEIVGVVADIKNESLTQRPRPEIYFSYAQFPTRGLSLMLRTTLPPLALAESLRREIGKVDSTLAVTDVQTMEQAKAESFNATGFQSLLLGGFAGLALLLAATGIYGVLSYSVGQRSREIGIRMALGARMDNVRSLVLRGGMKAVLLGIGLGLVAAVILTRFMARLLFQVDAIDPATLAAAAVMLIGTAVLACYIPAQRATRVDPMEALRSE
ncbi:MAG TPA: ABC transporter permease [Verrucomicrobiae bacterium]|nr:ABC transporter permease [Verrucomicrobiae bacterium]